MTDRPLHIRLFRMFVGAAVGLALCSIGAATGVLQWMATLPGEDLASVAVALMMIFLAGFAALVSSSQGTYKLIAENYREGDPIDSNTLPTMRVSGIILLMSGVLLLVPPIAVGFGLGESASMAVAGAMLLLVAVQTWLNMRVLRTSDELTRAAYTESCVISFWVTQLGLYAWALLAKLGLVATVSLWSLMIIAMGLYLAISIGAAIRRGLFA